LNWFIQQVGLAEAALLAPGFWERLWKDWSPGHGADDGAIGAELLGDVYDHLPTSGSAFEILDGAGHFLHLEHPDLIAARIADWLDA
jgi:pimeloyl-ACP methyl ester carboxylesterase